MIKKNVIIRAEHGLHIRPAAQFVKSAQQFNSDITITVSGKSVNAKSLFKLQTLELTKNTEITISANGSDELEAINKLTKIIETLK